MENEDRSQHQGSRNWVPYTELNQVSSDFAMAMALQEQERPLTALTTTINSESSTNKEEKEEDEISESAFDHESFNYNNRTYDYFESYEFDSFNTELGFLEGQGSNADDDDDEMDMEDDEIDVDELTYEDLIALGEFIGEEKRGLSLNEISRCLHACKSPSENKSGIDRCVICQTEYEEGEFVVALSCEHPYHAECVSNWLQVKKICPICSTEVSPTKNNICKL